MSSPLTQDKPDRPALTYVAAVAAGTWPVHRVDNPQNFVFDKNEALHPEADYYRAKGINYISGLLQARHGTSCSGLVAYGASNVK